MTRADYDWESDFRFGKILEAFTKFHVTGDVSSFCRSLSTLIHLPLILCTNTVYSSSDEKVIVAKVVSKIQEMGQENRHFLKSPVSFRIDDSLLGIAHFGKHAVVASYILQGDIKSSVVQLFNQIAPMMVGELDHMNVYTMYRRVNPAVASLGDTKVYYVLVKREQISRVGKLLGHAYIIYESNQFLNYCVLLVPDRFETKHEIFSVYQQMILKLQADLFVFSLSPIDKNDLDEELEPLKYMMNFLSYLEGLYTVDELSLLYVLGSLPSEVLSKVYGKLDRESLKSDDKQFLETLRLYSVVNNMKDVANLLGIHTNSVKYRLEKAIRLLGYDVDCSLSDLTNLKLLLQLEMIVIDA